MAVAGKVAITLSTENGGAWSADVTYDRLVAVKHNNNLYISRKTVANVEPPNDEFWFLALEGFGGDDVQALIDRLNELSDLIQAIIDGSTQVGNAKTLDGHGAEYFAPLSRFTGEMLSTSVKEKALSLDVGVHFFFINGTNYTGGDLPETTGWKYSSVLITKRNTNSIEIVLFDEIYPTIAITSYNGTKWSNWKVMFTTAGGTINGMVKVEGDFEDVFRVKNTASAEGNYINFSNADGILGYYGFNSAGEPVVMPNAWRNTKKLLHTGHKPNGSYTGNGDATQRTITTGATSEAIIVKEVGTNNFAVVVSIGWFGVKNGVFDSGSDAYLYASNIVLRSTSELFNKSGAEYRYSCL